MISFENAKLQVLEGTWDDRATLEEFAFATSDPEYGWIDSQLRTGSNSFPIALSHVNPPFCDMLAWLERLIAGESSSVLYIYDETDDHYFRVTRAGVGDFCIFENVAPACPAGGLYRRALVRFSAVVKAFDRWRMYAGRPQKYGTQFVPDGQRYRLWDVDPATTDDERAAWDIPSLVHQLRRAEEMTRTAPQPPLDGAPGWLKAALQRWRSP